MRKQTVSSLKKKIWKLCSEYVRRRDANFAGSAKCITCGATKHWKELQAGHFISGRHNAVLFETRGIFAQCYSCNIGKHGNQLKYYRVLVERYGEEYVKQLEALDRTTKQYTIKELLELEKEFKNKLLELSRQGK